MVRLALVWQREPPRSSTGAPPASWPYIIRSQAPASSLSSDIVRLFAGKSVFPPSESDNRSQRPRACIELCCGVRARCGGAVVAPRGQQARRPLPPCLSRATLRIVEKRSDDTSFEEAQARHPAKQPRCARPGRLIPRCLPGTVVPHVAFYRAHDEGAPGRALDASPEPPEVPRQNVPKTPAPRPGPAGPPIPARRGQPRARHHFGSIRAEVPRGTRPCRRPGLSLRRGARLRWGRCRGHSARDDRPPRSGERKRSNHAEPGRELR